MLFVILTASNLFSAGVWLQGETQHDPITAAEVNFLIFFWGEQNDEDCMIGQISSDVHEMIEVVLESPTVDGVRKRLTFAPAIQLYGRGREPRCVECPYRETGYRSTKTEAVFRRDLSGKGKGHAFRIRFPKDPHLRTFTIADVRVAGRSVKYTVGSLTDCKIVKNPSIFRSKVMSDHYALYHDYPCALQDIEEAETEADQIPSAGRRMAETVRNDSPPENTGGPQRSPFADTSPFAEPDAPKEGIVIKTFIKDPTVFSIKGNLIRLYSHLSQDKSIPLEKRFCYIDGKRWLPIWQDGSCRHSRMKTSLPSDLEDREIDVSVKPDHYTVNVLQPMAKNNETLSVQIKIQDGFYRRDPEEIEISIRW